MKARNFDSDYDGGQDVAHALDVSKARNPLQERKSVTVDFPVWMIDSLDKGAGPLGMTRQSITQARLASVMRHQHPTPRMSLNHSSARSTRNSPLSYRALPWHPEKAKAPVVMPDP